MPQSRTAVRTTQRPAVSGDGERRCAVTRAAFRIPVTAACLAFLCSLVPVALFAADPAAPAPPPPPETPKITLAAAEVPAHGCQQTLLSVDRFGRFSVRVENPQGSSLAVYDRMAGSLGEAGEAGGENGQRAPRHAEVRRDARRDRDNVAWGVAMRAARL